jgi:hypothetical protein
MPKKQAGISSGEYGLSARFSGREQWRAPMNRAFAIGLLFMAAGIVPARANLITNGDFATGDFTGWTLAATANGSLGPAPPPDVTSFDVTGSGATNAAEFQVGEVSFTGLQEGGSISQSITTGTGTLVFSAAIAATDHPGSGGNADGGVFSVLVDGVPLDSVDVGPLGPSFSQPGTVRGVLSFSDAVGAGSHDVEILITRPFGNAGTPFEYVTDVTADLSVSGPPPSSAPEPASLALLGTAIGGLVIARRRERPSPRR